MNNYGNLQRYIIVGLVVGFITSIVSAGQLKISEIVLISALTMLFLAIGDRFSLGKKTNQLLSKFQTQFRWNRNFPMKMNSGQSRQPQEQMFYLKQQLPNQILNRISNQKLNQKPNQKLNQRLVQSNNSVSTCNQKNPKKNVKFDNHVQTLLSDGQIETESLASLSSIDDRIKRNKKFRKRSLKVSSI